MCKVDQSNINPTSAPHGATGTQGIDGSSFTGAQANPDEGQWAAEVQAASEASGIPPEILFAQIHAESNGNPNLVTQNKQGGEYAEDVGLIQISQARWSKDVLPNLSEEDRQAITAATGVQPEDLDVTNPAHNVMASSFHLKGIMKQFGVESPAAATDQQWKDSLTFYNKGTIDGGDVGTQYYDNVSTYAEEWLAGKTMSQGESEKA
jgi:hypothetical protein